MRKALDFKFLLTAVNAKYIHSNPAVYSLRACVDKALQPYVELAEYTVNQSLPEILADIYGRKPQAIGFSCYIWNWRLVQELLAEIPKLLPGTALWLGGPEVSYDAEAILKQYPQLTGIMIGEGEDTFRELMRYYMGAREERISEELNDIKGLCLPAGYTPARPLTDMDSIPFLYYNLEPFENKIIYYETSRGCPFRCSYCLSSIDKPPCRPAVISGDKPPCGPAVSSGDSPEPPAMEKAVRFRNIDIVKKELQFFLDHRVKQVKFVDRTFNCNHEYAMAVWKYIYEHDNGITNFHFEISADILREEEIVLLNRFRPGLAQLEIGVQSVNPRTLKAVRRVTDLDKLEKAAAAVGRAGNVHRHLDLIAGLPFEDYESFRTSFNRVYHMRPEQLQLGFLKVLKGSEMWENAEEYGIRYLSGPPYEVLSTKWLSYEELLGLKAVEEMVELYYNSAQFTHTLPFLEKVFSDPFAMYEALADFYRQKGYCAASPARSRRYGILLEFAEERDGIRAAVYRELLTYDMYLRENLKSRPEFAKDVSDCRDAIRSFYQEEERKRRFLPDYGTYDWKQLGRMTHLEPFAYPVWDVARMIDGYESWGEESGRKMVETYEKREECGIDIHGSFVLFDYQKRNPLNYEAAVRPVEWCGENFQPL